jgi:hypothetical protein
MSYRIPRQNTSIGNLKKTKRLYNFALKFMANNINIGQQTQILQHALK